jgi:hypothetical protein
MENRCSCCMYWNVFGWKIDRETAQKAGCGMMLRSDFYEKSQIMVEILSNSGEVLVCNNVLTNCNFGCVLFEKQA